MQILDLPLHKFIIPTPFLVGPVNVYVITAPELVLVDVGPKLPEAGAGLEAGLRALSLRPEDVKKIFITHGHPDHYGQAVEFSRRHGAEIWAPPLDSPHFQHRVNTEFYRRMYDEAGVPEAVMAQFQEDFQRIQSFSDPIENYLPVDEATVISCGREELRIVATPGHTPGSYCLYSPNRRLLIAADTVIKRITPNPILDEDPQRSGQRYPSLKNYLASLAKLRALEVDLVCSGHGGDVKEFQPLYEKVLRHHEERQQKLLGLLEKDSKNLWQLARELFPEVEESKMFLALSEVFAHVDLMEDLGKVESSMSENVRMVRARRTSLGARASRPLP